MRLSAHEELNFEFYCVLVRLKRNSHVWLVVLAPISTGPDAHPLTVWIRPEPFCPERRLAARLSPSLEHHLLEGREYVSFTARSPAPKALHDAVQSKALVSHTVWNFLLRGNSSHAGSWGLSSKPLPIQRHPRLLSSEQLVTR